MDANLSRAQLDDANLSGAYPMDANLSRAKLGDANLSDASAFDASSRMISRMKCDCDIIVASR